jgi:hypothetical protein
MPVPAMSRSRVDLDGVDPFDALGRAIAVGPAAGADDRAASRPMNQSDYEVPGFRSSAAAHIDWKGMPLADPNRSVSKVVSR